MKQYQITLPLLAALLLSACGGDTALPDPTGKASIRAINAIPRSGSVSFLIEERQLEVLPYQAISSTSRYDDFSYNFNFEVRFAGDDVNTRIATRTLDLTADQDYTFVLSGSVANPVIDVWEIAERAFDGSETVFQARFANTAPSLTGTSVDVYFTLDGVAPMAGEQVATLAVGEVSAPADFEAGDYVMMLTTAGDFSDVLYTSTATTISATADVIFSTFDGNEDTTSPILAVGLSAAGSSFILPDPSYPPQIAFLHGAADYGDADIYDDEMLTSMIVDDMSFQQLTAEQPTAAAETTFSITPFDSTAVVAAQSLFTPVSGLRYRVMFSGSAGDYDAIPYLPSRTPNDTAAKMAIRHFSSNFDFLSLYLMPTGEVPDETSFPLVTRLARNQQIVPLLLPAGTRDLYVVDTSDDNFVILNGPVPIDLEISGVLDFVIFDNVADPSIVDLVDFTETP